MAKTPDVEQISEKGEAKPLRVSPSFRLHSKSLNIVRLRRIFDALDGNGDGQISVAELGQALQKLGLPIPLPELESTVRGFFSPGSDGLDFDAFVGLHRSLGDKLLGVSDDGEGVVTEEDEQDLKEAFGVFDEDGDGFISASELQGVLQRLGFAEANNAENMIHSVDVNRDGLVDFFEFKQMMTEVVTVKSS
ncbi:hypothetical protein SUGI_0778590 [Cryptomeria japonica]|uniref:probable calcium-binding protein CML43 n=1 Tax=Cryptomeria japonica TaxID=3369 RepID=UPI002414CD03|nr:probable calcium-binding protein CML43 [Cryptomeria japonica]GLJ38245.1 hypothetical protein SUGI_0778590 [Cryptomeria japonica]